MRIVRTAFVVALVFGLTVAVGAQDFGLGGRLSGAPTWFGGSDWNDSIDDFEEGFEEGLEADDDIDDADADADFGNLIGFGLGASFIADIGITPNLAVQPRVGYQRSVGGLDGEAEFEAEFEGNEFAGESELELTITADLLHFPVYVKPSAEVGPGNLYGLIGPELSFVIGDVETEFRQTVEANGQEIVDETETETEEPDNRFLYGGGVGAGYSIPAAEVELFFDAVFSSTFNSPADEGLDEEGDGPLLRNVSIGAGATTSF